MKERIDFTGLAPFLGPMTVFTESEHPASFRIGRRRKTLERKLEFAQVIT
jgi:hypothetical protein